MSPADSTPRRVALVTGGSRGIGRATSIELARRGYFVLINYVSDAQAAEDTLGEIVRAGGQGALLQFDVSDYSATNSAVNKAQKAYGPIEVLINNAGITRERHVHDDDREKLVARYGSEPRRGVQLL